MDKKKAQIDLITKNKTNGAYKLIIAHEGNWDGSNKEIYELQEKINDYLAFILDGHLLKAHPDSDGKPVCIQLDSDYDLHPKTKEFFDQFTERLNELRITLIFHKYEK